MINFVKILFMIRNIAIFSALFFLFAACNNNNSDSAEEDYCDCEMLALDNLYNHFYLEDRNNPYTGICKLFHKNGQLKQERQIVDGKNNGYYRVFSESGIMLEEGAFLNNRHHGLFRYFDENGELIIEVEYENGVRKAGNEISE
jgi:antitoxin component YwqK of YwqJK toxin-antitoxin module